MRAKANVIVFLAIFSVWGCRRKSVGLARVGPIVITHEEFGEKIKEVAPEFERYLLTDLGKKQFLDILIREKLMLAAAQDSDAAGSKEIQEGLRRLRRRHRQELKIYREHEVVALWREGLRTRGAVDVSEEDIDEFLRRHPREIVIRHILVGNPDRAHDLYKRIKQGENFSDLAKEHSLDAETSSRGGVLRPFLYGEVLAELAGVAFRMRIGEVNGVIRSKFGYHVLKKEKSSRVLFRDKKIRARVQDLLEKQQFDKYLTELEQRYPVEVYDEKFQ